MTYDEESYILNSITQIKAEVHQNNLMLRDLCNAVNVYLANHSNENGNDFGRNILANLISGLADLKGFRRS
jgi:hypothetical protein